MAMGKSGISTIAVAVGGVIALPIIIVLVAALMLSSIAGNEDEDNEQECAISGDSYSSSGSGVAVPPEYEDMVNNAAEEAGLPPEVIAAQINQESRWDPNAGSPVGAQGIAQFMPDTWEAYGEGGDVTDPEDAIPALGRYMAAIKKEVADIAGDDADELVRLTLAGYNAGPGAVQEHGGVPPYPETQDYVDKILNGGGDFASVCTSSGGGKKWDGDLGDGEWTVPLPNSSKTGAGSFGPRNIPGYPAWANQHAGVDLATDQGSYDAGGPVVAPADLKVLDIYAPDGCVQARLTGSDDNPEFGMGFCHLAKIDVKKGDELKRGDVIGTEGNQGQNLGNSQGGRGFITHLHFEIYPPETPDSEIVIPGNDSVIDPEPILKEKGAWPE